MDQGSILLRNGRTFGIGIAMAAVTWLGGAAISPRPAAAQIGAAPSTSAQTNRAMMEVSSPERRAADAYSRGARFQRKAEKESDAAKRRELLGKAREQFTKSLAEQVTFDALLAMGQVSLGLEERNAALEVCTRALGLKPGNKEATACVAAASPPAQEATPAAPHS